MKYCINWMYFCNYVPKFFFISFFKAMYVCKVEISTIGINQMYWSGSRDRLCLSTCWNHFAYITASHFKTWHNIEAKSVKNVVLRKGGCDWCGCCWVVFRTSPFTKRPPSEKNCASSIWTVISCGWYLGVQWKDWSRSMGFTRTQFNVQEFKNQPSKRSYGISGFSIWRYQRIFFTPFCNKRY